MPDRPIPNAVLIILDSVRADHLSCYGYANLTSPKLDALASRGTVFARCYAQSNATPRSMPTIFTGTPPRVHGVQNFGMKLRRSIPTLAEVLGRDGVRSCMVSSWAIFGSGYPLTRGFTECRIRDEVRGSDTMDADAITESALHWLQSAHNGRFFLCLHYGDAHIPYAAPCGGPIPPVKEPRSRLHALWRKPSRLRQALIKALLVPKWERRHALVAKIGRKLYGRGVMLVHPVPRAMYAINRTGVSVSEEEKRYIRYRYDQCIHYLDSQIGRIMEYMDSAGLSEDTMVMVTADHGEELFEHGRFGHGRTLYEELIRVPLVTYVPGARRSPNVWREPVRHIDLMPTIANAMGIEPEPDVNGRSLLRGFEEHSFQPGPVFAEGPAVEGSSACIIEGNLKLILNDTTDSLELYDLHADPDERANLAGRQPAQAQQLAMRLNQILEQTEPAARDRPEEFEVSAAVEKRLRDLGYW